MQPISLQINTLPLQITCYSNGLISIERLCNFHTIIDDDGTIISNEDIMISRDCVVEYGEFLDYKNTPELLKWLQNQQMIMPRFKKRNV